MMRAWISALFLSIFLLSVPKENLASAIVEDGFGEEWLHSTSFIGLGRAPAQEFTNARKGSPIEKISLCRDSRYKGSTCVTVHLRAENEDLEHALSKVGNFTWYKLQKEYSNKPTVSPRDFLDVFVKENILTQDFCTHLLKLIGNEPE